MSQIEPGCVVRRAESSDASAVHAVLLEAFEPLRDLYTPDAFSATVLSSSEVAMRIEEGPVWLVEHGNATVGTVSLVAAEGHGYIRGMGVTPAARRLGAGRALMIAVIDEATSKSLDELWLLTTPFLHAAIALYERHGFVHDHVDGLDFHGTPLLRMSMAVT